MKYLLILIIILGINSIIYSKKIFNNITKKKPILTLEESVLIALNKNPNLVSTIFKMKARRQNVYEYKANFYYPSIDLGLKYTYTDISPEPGLPVAPNKFSTSLSINKIIYNFGKLSDQLSISENNYQLAEIDYFQARNDLVKNVKTAYYTVLFNWKALKVRNENYQVSKNVVNYQKKNLRAGKILKSEFLRVNIQYQNDKIQLDKSITNYINSINHLYTLMGINTVKNYKEIPHSFKGQFSKYLGRINIKFQKTLEEAINIGQWYRPEVKKFVIQMKNNQLNQNISDTGWKPVVSVFSNVQSDYTQNTVLTQKGYGLGDYKMSTTFSIGIQMSFSLTDFLFPKSKARSQAKGFHHEAQSTFYQLQAMKNQIKQEITQNYLSLKEAQRDAKRQQSIFNMAKENFKISTKQYQTGVLDYLNYRDIELQYFQTQLSFYQELYNYYIALLNLIHSMGEYLK